MISINHKALEAYAAKLGQSELAAPDWRMPIYPASDDAKFVQFIGVQNSLNFCFTDPNTLGKYGVRYGDILWGGATGLCAALMAAIDNGVDILDVDVLANLSLLEARQLFASDDAPLPLLAERVALLNSLKASLDPYNGLFLNLIEDVGYDAGALEQRLVSEFPAYAGDCWMSPQRNETLTFNKRARLFAVMYEGRARSSKGALCTLRGIEAIGPIVDYQLPRALRAEGVLEYETRLANIVDNRDLIAPGSADEIAIREVTDYVIVRLTELVNAGRTEPVSMVEVDYALWVAGRKAGGEPHITLTTAY